MKCIICEKGQLVYQGEKKGKKLTEFSPQCQNFYEIKEGRGSFIWIFIEDSLSTPTTGWTGGRVTMGCLGE